MNSLARSFILAAAQFWHAARIAVEAEASEGALFYPVGHELGMACELALKSYLLERGVTPKTLRQKALGRQLDALLKLAIEQGLKLPHSEAYAVVMLNATHQDHFFRYGWAGDAGRLTGVRAMLDLPLCGGEIGNLIDRIAGEENILRKDFDKVGFTWPAPPPVPKPVASSEVDAMVHDILVGEQKTRDVIAKGHAKFHYPPGQD